MKLKQELELELLTLETMKLLGSTKRKIAVDKNGENASYLEITEVILIHFNVVNDSYQQNSRVLHTFVPNKSFRQLSDISAENFMFLNFFSQIFHILTCGLEIKILIF